MIVLCQFSIEGFSQAPYNSFPSWANIKTRFGAKGDGKTDDTKAIQQAINELAELPTNQFTKNNPYSTIYFPEGEYLISETIKIEGKIGFNLIGNANGKAKLKWIGKNQDTILLFNGSSYFKFSSFSIDANNKKNIICIGFNWLKRWKNANSQSYAPLNVEFSQVIFTGKPYIGLNAGTTIETGVNNNDSEVAIYDCQFIECTESGLKISGSNSLDYWIWNSRFINCYTGIKTFRGNYHTYYTTFENSGFADIFNDGGYYTSVRGSKFNKSNIFSVDNGASCNPFKRIFQRNYIDETNKTSILFYHVGKPFLLDNVFNRSKDSTSPYILDYQSWCPASFQIISVGNKFGQQRPYKVKGQEIQKFHLDDSTITNYSAREKGYKRISLKDAAVSSPVFEVPSGASVEVIQSIINNAVRFKNRIPTIHFPYGEYLVNQTIVIPANANINILGDGFMYGTRFKRGKDLKENEPVFKVLGSGKVSFEEIQILSSGLKGIGIEINGFDKPNAKAKLDQLHAQANSAVIMNGLDYLYIEKNNSFFSSGDVVIGGDLVKEGKGTAGLFCFGGQFAKVKVENGGRFIAKDCWWEGNERIPISLEGSGEVTLDGTMIAPVGADSNTTFEIKKFRGKVSVMNTYLQGGVQVNPNNPELNLLFLNTHFYHKLDPFAFMRKGGSYRAAALAITSQCFNTPNCGSVNNINDVVLNIENQNLFLNKMIEGTRRAMPKEILRSNSPAYFYLKRVSMLQVDKAIVFNK